MEPVNSQTNQNWTAETANEALGRIKPFAKSQMDATMFSIIGGIVAGISFVAGSPTIAFTAVVITGLTVAYAIYCKNKITSITQELQDRGLTHKLQSKLALSVFENALNETKNWTIESSLSFNSKIKNIFEGIASFHWLRKQNGFIEAYHDISAKKELERINLWVVEESVDEATKLSLLSLAVNNNVVLFFSSLQKRAFSNNVEGTKEFIRLKARDSALISAQFVKNCLVLTDEGDLDILAINRQLRALSPTLYKDLDSIETDETIYPIVQIRKNEDEQVVVELTANRLVYGAEGNVGDLIEILNLNNITIEIINDGWKAADGARFDQLEEKWNSYIQQYTQTLKYPTIVDRTSEFVRTL